MIAAPFWWWFVQPAGWRIEVISKLDEVISLLSHGPREPLTINQGKETLDRLTKMLETRAANLKDRYRKDEIFIVDHYWRYWLTHDFTDYLNANKYFVAKGGLIYRLFILSRKDLNDPDLETMLNGQCSIRKAGNGFELWLAHPDIMSHDEYMNVSAQFRQLPDTNEGFRNFDVLQLDDTAYFSNSFANVDGQQFLGRSVWIFNPVLVKKINLQPLFNESIADRFDCDHFQESLARARRQFKSSNNQYDIGGHLQVGHDSSPGALILHDPVSRAMRK